MAWSLKKHIQEDSQRVLKDIRDVDKILGEHLRGIKPLAANLQSKADSMASGSLGKPQPVVSAVKAFKQKTAKYASELKRLNSMMAWEDFWSSNMEPKVDWLKVHYTTLIHQLDSIQKLVEPIQNAGAKTITGSGGSLMQLIQGTSALAQSILTKLESCREDMKKVAEQLKEDPSAAEKSIT